MKKTLYRYLDNNFFIGAFLIHHLADGQTCTPVSFCDDICKIFDISEQELRILISDWLEKNNSSLKDLDMCLRFERYEGEFKF